MTEFESMANRPHDVPDVENPLGAGALSYDVAESICDKDDRKKVKDTTISPYYWICQLSIKFDQGSFVGSGWLCSVGSEKFDVVATSGHCVFETTTKKFANSITVTPARNGSSAPWGRYTVGSANLRASANWQAGGLNKAEFDYGAILIPKTGRLGSCGAWRATDSELKDREILNAGYPGDLRPYGFCWEHGGPISSVTPTRIFYMNDTMGGQSGSPALTKRKGDWWAVGIHGYGGCPNSAVRVTDAVFNDLLSWGK